MLKFKYIIAITLICFCLCLFCNYDNISYADSVQESDNQLSESIYNQLQDIDFTLLDSFLKEIDSNSQEIFNNSSFINKVFDIINNEYDFNFNNILNIVIKFIFGHILKLLPIICLIVVVTILSTIIMNFKSHNENSVKDIIHFVIYGVVIIILATLISACVTEVTKNLQDIQKQMEIIFPILLTLITSMGGVSTLSFFQPITIIVANILFDLFFYFLIPLFFVSLIFTIANNLTQNDYFSRFIEFFKSVFKWTIGIIFIIFTFYISIACIISASRDGLSIKISKYTMKNSIPYIGSYMSDGVDLFLSSSMLIKNSIGVCGLILLFSTILFPLIKLIIVNISLKLTSAILQPTGDKRISNFVNDISGTINMLIACIVSCSIFYFMCLSSLICLCNVI